MVEPMLGVLVELATSGQVQERFTQEAANILTNFVSKGVQEALKESTKQGPGTEESSGLEGDLNQRKEEDPTAPTYDSIQAGPSGVGGPPGVGGPSGVGGPRLPGLGGLGRGGLGRSSSPKVSNPRTPGPRTLSPRAQ